MSRDEDLSGRSRIVPNVIYSWISYVAFLISGFFMPRYIDESLGQFSLGVWDFCWSIVNYLTLTGIGIGASLNRFVAKYRMEDNIPGLQTAVSTVVVLQLFQSLLIFLAVSVFSYYLPTLYAERFGEEVFVVQGVLFLLGSSLAIQYAFDASRGVLTGCHRWDLFNGLSAVSYLVAVVLMIYSLYQGGGLVGISTIYLVMTLLQGIIRFALARKICPEALFRPASVSFAFAKEILVFGGKAAIISIAPLIVIQTAYIAIASTLGPAMLAIFARPFSLIKHIETFITRFAFILTPMAGSLTLDSKAEVQALTLSATKFGFAFTLPIFILFYFYGGHLIALWMGPDYVNTEIITILTFGSILAIAQQPVIRILIGLNNHGRPALMSFGLVVTIMSVGLLVIHRIGWTIEHIALLMVSTLSLVNGILIPVYACRKLDISFSRYVREVFMSPLLIGVAGTLLLLFFQEANLHIHILLKVSLFCSFVAICYWGLLLTKPQKLKLRKMVPLL